MAQVGGQFEVRKFYRESVSKAFKSDNIKFTFALVGGLVGYGLLRRLEVGRFASLTLGSAPAVAYAAHSLHRAQVQMGATALARGEVQQGQLPVWIRQAAVAQQAANYAKAGEALKAPTSTLEDGFQFRMVLLSALPEEEKRAMIQETSGLQGESAEALIRQHAIQDDALLDQDVIVALFAQYGWQKDPVNPASFGDVVAAIRLLHEHRERLPLLQSHLQYGYLQCDLLRGGRVLGQVDHQARNAEIKAVMAPEYRYTQECPDGISRERILHQPTHLGIFAWVWRNVSDEAKERMIQAVQCPLLVRQEIGYGVLPNSGASCSSLRYSSSESTVSREAAIAFLAMKGRPRYFPDGGRNDSFSVGSVALAGLILDLRKGEDFGPSLDLEALRQELIEQYGVNESCLDSMDAALALIRIGQPSTPPSTK